MRTLPISASLTVLALALGACTSAPVAMAPEELPTAFTAPQSAEAKDEVPSVDWWKGFGSDELSSLVDRAQAGNLDLAIYAARVEQARANTGLKWADLFPSVGVTLSGTRSGSKTPGSTANSFGLVGSASYEVDFWGKNREYLDAARNSARAAIFARDTEKLTVSADTANAYLTVLALRERLAIAKHNVELAKRVLGITQSKRKYGAESDLELAQQTATLRQTEASVPLLEEQEREARYALAILLGQVPEGFEVTGTSLDGIKSPLVKPGLPSDLLTRRPDIVMAEANLKAAHANLNAARLAFLPTISLTGQGGTSSTDFAKLLDPGSLAWSAGANVLQAIFDGGSLTSSRDYYKAVEVEQIATYRSAVLTALNDVESSLGTVVALAERERLIADQVANAREAFRISELRYIEGADSPLTILTVQQTLFSAEDTLAQVRLARLQAVVGLYRALGGGWSLEQAMDEPTRNDFRPGPIPF